MFEVPGSNIVAVTVDKDTVLGVSTPQYTHSVSDDDESYSHINTDNTSNHGTNAM